MSKYSKAFKLKLIHQCLTGASSPKRLATIHGIHYSNIQQWVNAYRAHGSKTINRGYARYSKAFKLTVLSATEVLLNGDLARLAPGARLRGQNNMLVISGAAIGQRLVVNYTVDSLGNVKDVWVLRDEEIANRPWPRTLQEAQTWGFNFDTQTWVKP